MDMDVMYVRRMSTHLLSCLVFEIYRYKFFFFTQTELAKIFVKQKSPLERNVNVINMIGFFILMIY